MYHKQLTVSYLHVQYLYIWLPKKETLEKFSMWDSQISNWWKRIKTIDNILHIERRWYIKRDSGLWNEYFKKKAIGASFVFLIFH